LLVEGYGLREVMTTEGKLIVNFIWYNDINNILALSFI
jgi:hypothetical protein